MPPEISFGREKLVSDMAFLAASTDQIRLTLLGAGGIGKTSVALHILHHDLVVNRYANRRYLICCDAITSAETLAELILRYLRMPPVYGECILKMVHRILSGV